MSINDLQRESIAMCISKHFGARLSVVV